MMRRQTLKLKAIRTRDDYSRSGAKFGHLYLLMSNQPVIDHDAPAIHDSNEPIT